MLLVQYLLSTVNKIVKVVLIVPKRVIGFGGMIQALSLTMSAALIMAEINAFGVYRSMPMATSISGATKKIFFVGLTTVCSLNLRLS